MKEKNETIRLLYIDDDPDMYLSQYLENYCDSNGASLQNGLNVELQFDELDYSESAADPFLKHETKVRSADIILLDYKLFEHPGENNEITGTQLRALFEGFMPYKKILILSQHKNIDRVGIIKKFSSEKCMNPEEESYAYYEKKLGGTLVEVIKDVLGSRQDISLLESNKALDKVLLEQVNSLASGDSVTFDLSDEKLDELICEFQALRDEILDELNG